MIACIYINGRPVAVNVELVEGTEEFIRQTRLDKGEVVAQVALLEERSLEIGQCPLSRCPLIRKYDADETFPGPVADV